MKNVFARSLKTLCLSLKFILTIFKSFINLNSLEIEAIVLTDSYLQTFLVETTYINLSIIISWLQWHELLSSFIKISGKNRELINSCHQTIFRIKGISAEEIIINLKNLTFGEHGIYYLSDNLFFHKSICFIAIVNLFSFVKTGITLLHKITHHTIPYSSFQIYSFRPQFVSFFQTK